MAISKITYKSSPSATPETWMDATAATAAASDITSPKSAMLANGVVTPGTGTTPTGTKQISITQNGTTTEDVAAYANAEITVNVQGGGGSSDLDPFPIPSGYSLPANYQKLLYAESSSAQICDTGVHPTLETRLEVAGYYIPGTYGTYKHIAGCADPSIYFATSGFDSSVYWGFGDRTDFTTIKNNLAGIPIWTIDKTEGRITNPPFADKTGACGATAMSGSADTTIGIFGRFNGRTQERLSPARIFRVRIWENDVLIRCIFPVLKDGTEVCLYDVVNGIYMPNLGTAPLVGGTTL